LYRPLVAWPGIGWYLCPSATCRRGFSRVPAGEAEYIFLDIFAGGNVVLILIYATAYRVFLQKFLLRWQLALL